MSTDEGVLSHVPPDDETGRTPPPSGRRRASRRRPRPVARVHRVEQSTTGAGRTRTAARVRPWHRDHPVFTPLAGFFTGVLLVLLVLGLLLWLLDAVFGVGPADHPWVFAVGLGGLVAVNVALLVSRRTRRFARYMVLGTLLTPTVVVLTATLTFYVLLRQDS